MKLTNKCSLSKHHGGSGDSECVHMKDIPSSAPVACSLVSMEPCTHSTYGTQVKHGALHSQHASRAWRSTRTASTATLISSLPTI